MTLWRIDHRDGLILITDWYETESAFNDAMRKHAMGAHVHVGWEVTVGPPVQQGVKIEGEK